MALQSELVSRYPGCYILTMCARDMRVSYWTATVDCFGGQGAPVQSVQLGLSPQPGEADVASCHFEKVPSSGDGELSIAVRDVAGREIGDIEFLVKGPAPQRQAIILAAGKRCSVRAGTYSLRVAGPPMYGIGKVLPKQVVVEVGRHEEVQIVIPVALAEVVLEIVGADGCKLGTATVTWGADLESPLGRVYSVRPSAVPLLLPVGACKIRLVTSKTTDHQITVVTPASSDVQRFRLVEN